MAEDLSKRHGPIGSLFRAPETAEGWARYRLSDEQVEHFRARGYVAGVRVLSDEQVDQLRAELSALADPSHPQNHLFYEFNANESADPARVLFHALGAWRVSAGFHDLLWHPAFTVPAAQLLDGAVRFWHDQLFCKPARHGGVVAWHQDYSYWTRTAPIAHLSCWIGLDDSTEENGCLRYVPGSHRWPLLPVTGLAGDMDAIRSVLTAEQRAAFEPVAVELRRGEASFHHPLLVHGSYENRSAAPRRAAVINVFRDGVRSASDDPPLEGVPAVPAGEKMAGRFFPLLLDPEEIGLQLTNKP
jgi:ectoine hydroxylase-related dioxygenase (phytanoyl-CoA dioxygenase family)